MTNQNLRKINLYKIPGSYREDIFQEYNEENFFKILNNFVKIKNIFNIDGSGRKIIEFTS